MKVTRQNMAVKKVAAIMYWEIVAEEVALELQ
jgi:hypothetical protein